MRVTHAVRARFDQFADLGVRAALPVMVVMMTVPVIVFLVVFMLMGVAMLMMGVPVFMVVGAMFVRMGFGAVIMVALCAEVAVLVGV